MTDSEILSIITEALDEVAPGKAQILGENWLNLEINALEIDSVVQQEMIGCIEELIDTTFSDEAMFQIRNMSDLAQMIRASI